MAKKKVIIVWGIIFLVLCSLYYQQNKKSPEQIVELVLNDIAEDKAEVSISDFDEYYQEQYREYFTDDAIKKALETRTFKAFQKVFPEFEGMIGISSLELERVKSSKDNVEIYGTIITDYNSGNDLLYTQKWQVKSRLSKEDGTWKICYLYIYMAA